MYLLDTNALIHFIKNPKINTVKEKLYTTIFNIVEFPIATHLELLEVILPSQDTYYSAIEYSVSLRDHGIPMATIDLLIGVLSVEHKLTLVSDDSDFQNFEKIEPKFQIILIEKFLKKIN